MMRQTQCNAMRLTMTHSRPSGRRRARRSSHHQRIAAREPPLRVVPNELQQGGLIIAVRVYAYWSLGREIVRPGTGGAANVGGSTGPKAKDFPFQGTSLRSPSRVAGAPRQICCASLQIYLKQMSYLSRRRRRGDGGMSFLSSEPVVYAARRERISTREMQNSGLQSSK